MSDRRLLPQTARVDNRQKGDTFPGFEPLASNFIYCPNQFFDVCLPNQSRGCIRLVAYMLRRTLGWFDENGNPLQQQISVSYRELVAEAGVSRGAARRAIDEAIAAGYITCNRQGRPKGRGQSAETARFELRWDDRDHYIKDPVAFRGFYAGQGHRSPIPTAFFEHVLPTERLAVIKVVGAVLRHTVGYQNQFGGRRSHAALAYSYLQRHMNLTHRATLAKAIRDAMAAGYVHRVRTGCFGPRSEQRQPATYAVRWLEEATLVRNGSKTEPATSDRFKKRTSIGSESEPANRFKKRTEERTVRKQSCKQQQQAAPAAAEQQKAYRLLRKVGFDELAAAKLSRETGLTQIQRQVDWIDARNPQENKLGMLRRAIEADWPKPAAFAVEENKQQAHRRRQEQQAMMAAEDEATDQRKRKRLSRRQALMDRWRRLSLADREQHHRAAIKKASSESLRRRLSRHTNMDEPPTETLLLMADRLAIAIGESA